VNFVDKAKGAVGVSTDDNEFSGTQCARLGWRQEPGESACMKSLSSVSDYARLRN
jgi:hypothetical protein